MVVEATGGSVGVPAEEGPCMVEAIVEATVTGMGMGGVGVASALGSAWGWLAGGGGQGGMEGTGRMPMERPDTMVTIVMDTRVTLTPDTIPDTPILQLFHQLSIGTALRTIKDPLMCRRGIKPLQRIRPHHR